MQKKKLFLILVPLFLLPVWMWLAWVLSPKRRLVAAIVDKTVLTPGREEHVSLDWILNQERFTRTKRLLYKPSHDYFGFFPGRNEQYKLKGLERFSTDQLATLSNDADLVYFADTYGVYTNEWYKKPPVTGRAGLVYGGMSSQDLALLSEMKAKHKLMIAEFNTMAAPTSDPVRAQFESMFGLRWTGWTGRYFASLDTLTNKELPHWAVTAYRARHEGLWPFHRPGLVFVNKEGLVVILEDSVHLTDPMPSIESAPGTQRSLDLPETIKYPFWFDIIDPSPKVNTTAASFVIHANANGLAELDKYRIPSRFPAVLSHQDSDYHFYYFSGDFCKNSIPFHTSFFKGIAWFRWLFYDSSDPGDGASFFWNFYRPMMSRILLDYSRQLPGK
jgi:hypothetical protein